MPVKLKHLSRQQLGFLGERLVADALYERGFEIIGRNIHTRFGEIDVIAKKGRNVLFVEVKTRTSRRYGYPEEAITFKKRMTLSRCALALSRKFARGCHWAIVIVAVEINVAQRRASLMRIELDG